MSARLLLVLATVALAAACGAQGSGGAGGGGLYGTVVISPATPVCAQGRSCSRLAKGFRLVFAANGKTVTTQTDSHGRYRVKLERGRYTVRYGTAVMSRRTRLQPGRVTVPRGRFARRNFIYDSGIR